MILTLTMNPAVDRNLTVDQLVFDDRAYILASDESPGGRGINASCVIHSFGGKTAAVAPVGGETGRKLRAMLECCGFPTELVPVKAPSRTNLNISDQQGLTIKLNESGSAFEAEEVAGIEQALVHRLPEARWLMLCGSLPPGVPVDFYARMIETANQLGVKTLLDADGEAFETGMEARPTVIAPNQAEAERLLNKVLLTRQQSFEAAERLRLMGPKIVVLSLGSRGAVAAVDGSVIEAVPPRIDVVCPIGAGDALAASFVWALRRQEDYAEALRWGVAAGTASAQLPGLKFASLEQTREMQKRVEVRVNSR